jgi:phage shock protein A
MPRGVKGSGKPKKTIDERIADIDVSIAGLKKDVSDLMAQKRSLQKEKKNENKNELIKVVAESGLTPDELLDLINKAKK